LGEKVVCIDDEVPYELPLTWRWERLGNVVQLLSGTDFPPSDYNDMHNGIPYITGASSLSESGVLINRWTPVPKVLTQKGDILLVCKGSGYGKTVICDIEKAHIARQIMAIRCPSGLITKYILFFIQANFDRIKTYGQGVIPGIDRNSILSMLLPVPSREEQHRIVAKIDELMTLVKTL